MHDLIRHERPDRHLNRIHRAFLGPLITLILLGIEVSFAQNKLTPLAEMTGASGTILAGKVMEVRQGVHPDYRNIEVTYVTLHVDESLKGKAKPATNFTFMQFGGLGPTRVADLPGFAKGEAVLVFLYPSSPYGFTSPVGGTQGKFRMFPTPEGSFELMNGIGNAGLFDDLKGSLAQFSVSEQEVIRRRKGSVEYKTFRSILRKTLARPLL